MRNLKRALSLALASVMLLGMMVVGTSAASYPDVDENDNVEAIEVLNAVNVMIGRQGNFDPDAKVNRHEMAVIMAKLYLGVEIADNYVGTHPFTDVVPWADKYVAACYENGLVYGTSATTFGGSGTLTAVQAAAMMLRALGYKDLNKGYQGDWRAPITAMANQIRLFSGVASNPNEYLDRNQVAQLALNTLKSPMVNLKDNTISWTDGEGQVIMTGGSRDYIALSSHEAYAKAINDTERAGTSASGIEGWTVELGEHLYNGKLKLNSNAKDVFGRPSNNWQYDGKDVGTYVNYDLRVAEYKTGVTGAQLYDLLTYTTINDNDLLTWIDGVDSNVSKDRLVRSNKDNVNGSNTGVLTEVFVDLDHKEVTISAINTYLAQANSDYNKTNETLSLNVYQTNGTGSTKIVDVKDVPEVADVLKDDYRLVYLSGWEEATSLTDYTRFHVVDMFDVDIMAESSVTKWSSSSSKVVDKLTTGGAEYKSNIKAFYDMDHVFGRYNDQLLTDTSYNIYLDRYGNVIGVDLAEGNKNYVFITGYDRGVSHISVKTADAAAIFMDGTMDTIVVNVTDTDKNITNAKNSVNGAAYGEYLTWQTRSAGAVDHNRWYTYTVASNGTYTLKPVENFAFTAYTAPANYTDTTRTLNSANLFLDDSGVTNKGRFYGNDDSVYLTVSAGRVDMSSGDKTDDTDPAGKTDIADVKDAIADVEGVYTGAQNVKIDLKPEIKQETNTSDACYASKVAEKNAYVYSIFDKNYYIIASVVLGEAQGAATNYIYTLDGAKSERVEHGSSSRAAADDTYYWEVDAVVNGEKTTLTVKSKYHQTVDIINANVNKLVEVRYDGEYVTKIDPVNTGKIFTNQYSEAKIEDMKVYDVGGVSGVDWALTTTGDNGGYVHYKSGNVINATLNGNDKNGNEGNCRRISGNIELVGRTLYTDRARGDVGLALAADAKAVLVQPENGKVQTINCGSVSEAVGRLADRNPNTAAKEFKGRVVAVLNSAGVAQWVVIVSDTNLATGNKPNYDQNGEKEFMINNTRVVVKVQGLNVNNVEATIDRTSGEVEVYVPKNLARITDKEAADALYDSVIVQINNGVELKAEYDRSVTGYYVYTVKDVFVNTEKDNVVVITVKAKEAAATKYAVTIGTVTGGTVTADKATAAANETVTLTATPTTAGYVPSYTVTWTGGTVAVAANGTFTMPAGAVTVNAAFTDPAAKTYDITIGTVTGGTVTASATKAAEGTEITLTATPTTAGETATFTVTKASGGTVTVDNGKFTMPAENVTVTAVFSSTPSSDIEVTIDYDKDPYEVTVEYSSKEPTPAELKDAINKQLKADGKEANVTSVYGTDVFVGDDAVGTIVSSTGSFKVYVNRVAAKDAEGKDFTFATTSDAAANAYVGSVDAKYLVNKDDPTMAGLTISGAGSNKYVSFDPSTLSEAADVYLVPGYKMAAQTVKDASVDETKVVYGGETYSNTSGSDLYFPTDAVLTLTGKKTTTTDAGATNTQLKVGGTVYATKTIGDAANTYELDLAKAAKDTTMINASGDIQSITEDVSTVTTIKATGTSFNYEYSGTLGSSAITITLKPSEIANKPADGTYVMKTAGMGDYTNSNASPVVVAVSYNSGTRVLTLTPTGGSFAAVKGVMEIMPVTTVKFAATTGVTPKFQLDAIGSAEETINTSYTYYFKPSAKVNFIDGDGKFTVQQKLSTNAVGDPSTETNMAWTVPAATDEWDNLLITFLKKVDAIELANGAVMDLGTPGSEAVKDAILGTTAPDGYELDDTAGSNTVNTTATSAAFKVKAKAGYYIHEDVVVSVGETETGANKWNVTLVGTPSLDTKTGLLTINITYAAAPTSP